MQKRMPFYFIVLCIATLLSVFIVYPTIPNLPLASLSLANEKNCSTVCNSPKNKASTYSIYKFLSLSKPQVESSLNHLRIISDVPFANCFITKTNSRNDSEASKATKKLAEQKLEQIRDKNLPYLLKTVFNSSPKVVFFLGLEGTGHHYVKTAFKELYETNYSEPFLGYWEMLRCKPYSEVFKNMANIEKLKKLLLGYQSQVLFMNTVEGYKFSID